MLKTPIADTLITELRQSFGPTLELPTEKDIKAGISLSELAFRAGFKACIDYLETCCELQKTANNIQIQ